MAGEIQKDSINVNHNIITGDTQQAIQNENKKDDISVWLQDNGNNKFDKNDIIDESLKNDSRFWDTVKDLVGKPLDEITKTFLQIQKKLYDLTWGKLDNLDKQKSESTIKKEKIQKNYNDGTDIGRKLDNALKKSNVNIEEVKVLFDEITPENVAYVVVNCNDIAEKIDDVFDWGNGFDKTDVYNQILSKLIQRAEDLEIADKIEESRNDIWAKPYSTPLSPKSSLEDMSNAIHVYHAVIYNNEYKLIL